MASPHDRLASRSRQWNVTIEHIRETQGSLLAFGRHNNDPVVLKLTKQQGDEWHSGRILQAFEGAGTVRVYEYGAGAVLLERLDPGNELVELVRTGDDEEATQIVAQVMKQMAHHTPPANCPTVLDWGRAFDRYQNNVDSTPAKMPEMHQALVTEAAELYRRLTVSQRTTMLLHGDLQHYNVLFDSCRGWVAIDPKGVVGELEYELGAILRNPVEQPDYFRSPTVIERRLRVLTDLLKLDYRRALEWSFAQAVLSAIWDLEDGYVVNADAPVLKLAVTVRSMLQ